MNTEREALAALAHEQWSGWMKYLFSKCVIVTYQGGERVVAEIPHWARERWVRQMNTPYDNLSEEEKESDRAEADRVFARLAALRSEVDGASHAPSGSGPSLPSSGNGQNNISSTGPNGEKIS